MKIVCSPRVPTDVLPWVETHSAAIKTLLTICKDKIVADHASGKKSFMFVTLDNSLQVRKVEFGDEKQMGHHEVVKRNPTFQGYVRDCPCLGAVYPVYLWAPDGSYFATVVSLPWAQRADIVKSAEKYKL